MNQDKAFIVLGLGFGDEGKGSLTDFLVRASGARAVVRFNGGPQAGHNVVAPDGRWHCFAQFGAGTFVPGTRTLLSREMLIEPENLEVEAEVLRAKGVTDAAARMVVDPDCNVITPMHKMIGQMLEISRGPRATGTCGMGVGQAVRDREREGGVSVREVLSDRGESALARIAEERIAEAEELVRRSPSPEMEALRRKFRERCLPSVLHLRYREVFDRLGVTVASTTRPLRDALDAGSVVFEGAQGALLDREFGFVPFVTRTRTTATHAAALLAMARPGRSRAIKVGVLRAYGHRHGPGPFVTEDGRLTRRFADRYNSANRWQGRFRVGRLDLVALRYGILVNGGVDLLAVTGLDRLTGAGVIRMCASYAYDGDTAGLDRLFEWKRAGPGRARILAIRRPAASDDGALARALMRCRPLDWIEFPGWRRDLSGARTPQDLPSAARRFIEFLGSRRGLGVPIGIASVRPDAAGKVVFRSEVPSLAQI